MSPLPVVDITGHPDLVEFRPRLPEEGYREYLDARNKFVTDYYKANWPRPLLDSSLPLEPSPLRESGMAPPAKASTPSKPKGSNRTKKAGSPA